MADKKLATTAEARRRLVEPGHEELSIERQCQLLGLPRSTCYARPATIPSQEDLDLMRLLDGQYLKTPFYGARKMALEMRKHGYAVGRKRVRRLRRTMGLIALGPRPRTSQPPSGHKIFPYLLRDVEIKQVDQVWSSDITCIPMRRGFVYLAALEGALAQGRPEIFNTDQGAQFTSQAFMGRLLEDGIRVSMDGRGRALDNVFIERLWRSLKYEEIYLNGYDDVRELRRALERYFRFYNEERPHQALEYKTPGEVWRGEGGGAGRMTPSPPKHQNQNPFRPPAN